MMKKNTRLSKVMAICLMVAIISSFFIFGGPVKAAANIPRIVTNLSIDDVVVITHNVVEDYGADNTGVNDCTTAFQNAIDDAYNNLGGIVFVPAGCYKFTGHLYLKSGVTLRGEWRNPDIYPTAAGSILMPYENQGNENGEPFIRCKGNSTIKDLSFWYPNQSISNVSAYPWTIAYASMGMHANTFYNLTFYNSYKGIITGDMNNGVNEHTTENHFRNIYGTFLKTGLRQYDLWNWETCNNLNIKSNYWFGSGFEDAPKDQNEIKNYTRDNLIAIDTYEHCDGLYYYDVNINDANIGVKDDCTWMYMANFNIQDCITAIWQNTPSVVKYMELPVKSAPAQCCFIGGTIKGYDSPSATTYGIKQTGNAATAYQGITITGNATYGAYIDNSAGLALDLMNCTFSSYKSYGVYVKEGQLMLSDSTFNPTTNHVYLGNLVSSANIQGNTFPGGTASISNNVASEFTDLVTINNEALGCPKLPATTTNYSFIPERKPANPNNFFNIMDYGAVRVLDNTVPSTDSTNAIQSALDAASIAGGGTVFIPVGGYRVNGNLTIPTNVELRGVAEGPRLGTEYTYRGSTLYSFANRNNPVGTPFITMNAISTLKGLNIYYPEQTGVPDNSSQWITYPYTIRGNGSDILIRNVVLANSYDGIDLFTNKCDNFMLDSVWGNPRNTGIFIGGGSNNGRMENCMFCWTGDVNYPNGPADSNYHIWSTQYPFKYGKCDGLTTLETFVFYPYSPTGGYNGTGNWFVSESGGSCTNANIILTDSDGAYAERFYAGGTINIIGSHCSMNGHRLEAGFTGTVNFYGAADGAHNEGFRVDGGNMNIIQGILANCFKDIYTPIMTLNSGISNIYNYWWQDMNPHSVIVAGAGITSAKVVASGAVEGINAINNAGSKLTVDRNIDTSRNARVKGDILMLKGSTDSATGVNKVAMVKACSVDRTWQSGDYIEYDVRVDGSELTGDGTGVGAGVGGLDIYNTDGSYFRDRADWVDQSGKSGHPGVDLDIESHNHWYHRKLQVPASMVGKKGSFLDLILESDSSSKSYVAYYDNILVTNGGNRVYTIYEDGVANINQIHSSSNYTDIVLWAGSVIFQKPQPSGDKLRLWAATDGTPATNNKYLHYKTQPINNPWGSFKAGDYIEYDVYLEVDYPSIGGIEIYNTDGTYFRDSAGWVDQKNISGHPGSTINGQAFGKWYHRKLKVPDSMVGKTPSFLDLSYENDGINTALAARYDNIRITDGVVTRCLIWDSGTPGFNATHYSSYYTGQTLTLTQAQ